ncbi:MAG: Na/Pi cotransporter family protein [Clostridia bacterium]|nr:Na/Pi cotransporter family protein [Clostridia bacterium]
MDIFGILTLCGGIAMFLYGMRVMGDGIEKRAGRQMSMILEKLTANPIKGILLGAGVTGIIQSSAATTVMVVGFVNSGIMKLSQATGVIMGANLGTTVTAWILSLSGIHGESLVLQLLKPSSFSPVLALIGIILLLFAKKNKHKDVGTIMLGFAVLMFGMQTMSGAVEPLADMPEFTNILTLFKNPVLGTLTGVAITAVIQSSSASVGILQAISVTGVITFDEALPIILGMNIGACIITLLSSVGTSREARRAAFVHLYFSLFGKTLLTALFLTADLIFSFPFMDMIMDPVSIAIMHTVLNLISIIAMLPFRGMLEHFAILTVKDGHERGEEDIFLDKRFLTTPGLAVDRSRDITKEMADLCITAFRDAASLIAHFDDKVYHDVIDAENRTDLYEDRIGSYLVVLSAESLTHTDNRNTQKLLHAIGDFERIGDHALNIAQSCEEMHRKGVSFSPAAASELRVIMNAVSEVLELSVRAFFDDDTDLAARVEPLEDVVDDLRAELKSRHIERLQQGACTIELGFIFSDLLTNFERISDHCSNIAAYVIQTSLHSMETHSYMHGLKTSGSELYDSAQAEYRSKYNLEA